VGDICEEVSVIMPEIRYIDVYDGQGNLIAQEPYEVSDEQLEAETNQARLAELRQLFADCHSSHVIPLPDLTSFMLLICEYITRSQPI